MSSDTPSTTDLAALQDVLAQRTAPWIQEMGLVVMAAAPGEVTLSLPVAPALVHGGQVLCGQASMAAADTAMVLAISTLQGFRPMTTVQLQTSFLRPIGGSQNETLGAVRIVARVLRAGKSLAFGEIEIFDAQDHLAAHSTTTYALL